jgi:NAD(P)-dependent dehydrogenase (short-subunit alcohol dehydrogenase family)
MKSAALELGPYHITANALFPGLIDTALTRHEERYAQVLEDAGKQPTGSTQDEEEARKTSRPRHRSACPGSSPEMSRRCGLPRMVSGATFDVTAGDSAHNTA